jgi:chromate reductase, NAD(P)H dehydrogenase (quinone)
MKVLGLSGSLRATSTNTRLLESILYGRGFAEPSPLSTLQVSLYNGIGQLPHYNADLDKSSGPSTVADWRSALAQADGVIICTPEYAFGIPGVLKNALDWIASSGELVGKPVMAISASPGYLGGDKAHASLLLTLSALSANIIQPGSISIPAVGQVLDGEGCLTDLALVEKLLDGLQAFYKAMASQA